MINIKEIYALRNVKREICIHTKIAQMSEQIAKLRCERDTARRMYCSEVDNTRPHGIYAEDIAKSMGWDCYKKEETK